jgi:hypothetical protein
MSTPQQTLSLADVSLSCGGPIKKDRLWFFYNTRWTQSASTLPGIYYNLNAGDPTKWLYAPDFSRSVENSSGKGAINPTLRITAQVSPKNKLNMYWDPSSFHFTDNPAIGGITGPTAGAPETTTGAGGSFAWSGRISANPPKSAGKFVLRGFVLKT